MIQYHILGPQAETVAQYALGDCKLECRDGIIRVYDDDGVKAMIRAPLSVVRVDQPDWRGEQPKNTAPQRSYPK